VPDSSSALRALLALLTDGSGLYSQVMSTGFISLCNSANSGQVCRSVGDCLHAHDRSQLRRSPFKIKYSTHQCENLKDGSRECPNGTNCEKAHNKMEQMYHPQLYKTRVCRDDPDGTGRCPRGKRCCFAHGPVELREFKQDPFEAISLAESVKPPSTAPAKAPRSGQAPPGVASAEREAKRRVSLVLQSPNATGGLKVEELLLHYRQR
jgi:hypothetical protein